MTKQVARALATGFIAVGTMFLIVSLLPHMWFRLTVLVVLSVAGIAMLGAVIIEGTR